MESSPKTLKRFLLVDDDEAFRTRLGTALQKRGLEVFDAATVDAALALAKKVQPHAAVIDLRMPGGSGLDLVPQLAAAVPGIQMVVLTGYGTIATAVEAVRRGAINYLTKPLDADQILAAFEKEADPAAGAAPSPAAADGTTPSLARVEWEHIQRILHDSDGNISMAARKLGIHRRSLQRKLAKLPPDE